jgi:hypothetical protein
MNPNLFVRGIRILHFELEKKGLNEGPVATGAKIKPIAPQTFGFLPYFPFEERFKRQFQKQG